MTERLGPPLAAPIFERIAIVGVGLIGSSIARAARRKNAAGSIAVADASPQARARAAALRLGDKVVVSAAEAAAGADLVILCAPVGANEELARQIAPALKAGAIVSDVGSVKGAVIAAVGPHLPANVHLVPAHPVAGTEEWVPTPASPRFSSTVGAFSPRLTAPTRRRSPRCAPSGRRLAPMSRRWTPPTTTWYWRSPATCRTLSPTTSSARLRTLRNSTRSEVVKFSAGGFRDFTRIAASDPTMWRDVFLNNKDAVLEALGRFSEDLTALQRMIRRGDGEGLFALFSRTRAIRRGIVELGQETAAPDFGRRKGEDDNGGS